MRFLANENFPLASVRELRKAGHDVSAVVESSPGARDSEVLEKASAEARTILTFDRDYGELIFRHRSTGKAAVVYFRFIPVSPEEPAEYLIRLLAVGGVHLERKFTVV
jgi:predicted nuclease of predicted toxin-antitoxin system